MSCAVRQESRLITPSYRRWFLRLAFGFVHESDVGKPPAAVSSYMVWFGMVWYGIVWTPTEPNRA